MRDLIRLRPTISGTTPTPGRIDHCLFEFFTWCAEHDHLPELPRLARAVDRWRDPIITSIRTGVSNARSEGLNRVIKLEGRKARTIGPESIDMSATVGTRSDSQDLMISNASTLVGMTVPLMRATPQLAASPPASAPAQRQSRE